MQTPPLDAIVVIDDTVPRPGAMNMALDEVLLGGLADTPLLRCYRWREHEVSFGCFGRIAEVENVYPGVPKVRRWTGGGMVEHGADFTFTVFVPRTLPLARLAAADSYQSIHAALATALRHVGINGLHITTEEARLHPTPLGDAPFLKPCFSNPVEHDLLSGGKKIAGGAQRRTRHGLLHQGSVQNQERSIIFSDTIRADLSSHLAAALATKVTARSVSDDELTEAQNLTERKYGTAAWTERF